MPSTTHKPPQKRKTPAFKPPIKPTKSAKPSNPRRKSEPSKRPSYIANEASASGSASEDEDEVEDLINNDDNSDDSIPSDTHHSRSPSSSIVQSPAPRTTVPPSSEPPPTIPPALLTRLLHHHFKNKGMRIGKEANGAVGKYMETFVREAIARAAFERSEAAEKEGGRGIGDDFLEVEDLEKLSPQLLLDF